MSYHTVWLLTIILTLWSALAHAAVAIGAVSTAKAFLSPPTTPHDGGTGQNRLTIACVVIDNSSGISNTAATYASVPMIEWGRHASADKEAVLWYLAGSATGSNTLGTTMTPAGSTEQTLSVVTFTGVNQVTPVRTGTATTANGTGTAVSVSPTSVTGDMVVDCVGVKDSDTFDVTGSVGIGQSQAAQHRSDFYILNLVSWEIAGAGSSTNMTWTLSQSEPWSAIAGALIPAVSTARPRVGAIWLGK